MAFFKVFTITFLISIAVWMNGVDAQGFGFGGGGMGGGGGGGGMGGGGFRRGFAQLSQDLTPQQREQVKSIMMDPSTPKYVTKQRLAAFYRSIGGNAEAHYLQFREKMEAAKSMRQSMFERRAAMMDPAMLQIMQQIRQVHQNQNISFAQSRAQIQQIIASAPPEVKSKFQAMRERFRGRLGGGNGGGGMFGGGGRGGGGFGMFGGGGGGFQLQQQQQFNRF